MNLSQFDELKQKKEAFMLYFHNDTCTVCKHLYPKIEELIRDKFPRIELIRVSAEESRELAGQLRMLSIPGILLYLEGREFLRSNGMTSLDALENQIQRPYHLMFN